MKRLPWHIPTGIFASLLVHFFVAALVLGVVERGNWGPSALERREPRQTRDLFAPLDPVALSPELDSLAEEKGDLPAPNPDPGAIEKPEIPVLPLDAFDPVVDPTVPIDPVVRPFPVSATEENSFGFTKDGENP